MAGSHIIDYKLYGEDLQFVEVELDPNETVIAEAGTMMYMESGVDFTARMGDGSNTGGLFGKLMGAGKRMLTGESIFLTHFTNRSGGGKRKVAFAAPYPGTIMAIDLDQVNGKLICQRDSFLAAAYGTRVSIAFNKRLGAGLFGGEGFILQKLEGDGMAFIHAGGTMVERHLNNETIRVDTGCIVAFESGISYDIQRAGNMRSMLFGGEGLFLATLSGTGRVWIQSLPFSRLADRILANASFSGGGGGGSVGETDGGSLFRGIGNLLDG